MVKLFDEYLFDDFVDGIRQIVLFVLWLLTVLCFYDVEVFETGVSCII